MSSIHRIVDAYIDGKLAGSYPVSWTLLNQPAIDADAVELAQQAMEEDGFTPEQIKTARYVVRIS